MLGYALAFLILALIAGMLGLTGIAGLSADVAWTFFVVFLTLTVAAGVVRALRGLPPA